MCPRKCNVSRDDTLGFCGAPNAVKVSLASLFLFEEPIISGEEKDGAKPVGSGAIFFSHCNLKCCYCQNSEISTGGAGKEITINRLAEIFKKLESAGAYNINLVTPTHYTNQIIEALKIYKPKIPVIWNTSGFDDPEVIKKLDGYVDIFLTDFKYFSGVPAKKYSSAENYPEIAKKSILMMRKVVPNDVIENGLMKKGIIIRHLVLPGQTKDSLAVIDWINKNLGNKTYVSLMAQYTPMANAKLYPEINRKIKPIEYKILINRLTELGFCNVFLQDLDSATSSYTPDFLNQKSDIEI